MRATLHKTFLKIFCALLLAPLTGCIFDNTPSHSVLILAVDSLPMTAVSCDDAESNNENELGFSDLCEESIRFTHAYTPSTLAVPALASLLTGLYPYEHQVRHNGSPGLSARIETLPELAVKAGYRTAFFSGGPPVFRKSGLAQGFELFDDAFPLNFAKPYRPFQETRKLFFSWLESEVGSGSFFSVLYLSDLQFPMIPTETASKIQRERSGKGQLGELGEELHTLIQDLKRANRWNSTTIVVVGLNGVSQRDRQEEIDPLNLYDENTQIALFIKPETKPRDKALSWKIDSNISSVDIAATFFHFFGKGTENFPLTPFARVALIGLLKNENPVLPNDRKILVESGWGKWRENLNVRMALHQDNMFLLHQEPPLLFNQLADRFQMSPLNIAEEHSKKTIEAFSHYFNEYSLASWKGPSNLTRAKYRLAAQLFTYSSNKEENFNDLKTLSSALPGDSELMGWRARFDIKENMWKDLLEIGKKMKRDEWIYTASRVLGKTSQMPADGCLTMLLKASSEQTNIPLTSCTDDLSLNLAQWIRAKKDSPDGEIAKERFLRNYFSVLLDSRIAELNAANGFIWDVSNKWIRDVLDVDLYLELPEARNYKNQVRRRLTELDPHEEK